MSRSNEPVRAGKWVEGISPCQPLRVVAHRLLDSRLSAVWHWLPLAADRSDEDNEYVHQLRVSTRRAVEALRVFSDLLPGPAYNDLRAQLRRTRLAADEARNLDVLCGEFVRCADSACEDTCHHIVECIRHQRKNAQRPIVAIHRELEARNFGEQIVDTLAKIRSESKGKSKRKFGRLGPRYLKRPLQRFFIASEADLTDDEALHQLRIRTKKLRYTMEIVEVAFQPYFRNKLYTQVTALQDIMGSVNDHATAKVVFGDWISRTDDDRQRAFFRGILLAEMKAHEDLRKAFYAVWTPKAVRKLQREFRACCGIAC